MTEPVEVPVEEAEAPDPRVMLELDTASVRMEAEVRTSAALRAPATVDHVIEQRLTAFDVEDYMVLRGVPVDVPRLGVALTSRVGLGSFTYDDARPAPHLVNTGAAARWLPQPESWTEGESWRPVAGGELQWNAVPTSTPYLDPDYSYELAGREVLRPALVFPGNSWLRLNTTGWSATAATLAVVAVMRTGTGSVAGPYYSVLESAREEQVSEQLDGAMSAADAASTADPTMAPVSRPTDFGLRYSHGNVSVWAGSTMYSHDANQDLGRPIAMVLSLEPAIGRLGVLDMGKATRSFSMQNIAIYDVDLFLGRSGASPDPRTTAVMDVLEIDYYDRAMDFEDIEVLLAAFDAMYGITA